MATVHVSNISPRTQETELKEFFSYCGEFENFKYEPSESQPGTATITFKRDTAAQTARLLDNTELNGSPVKVEVAASLGDLAGQNQATGSAEELKQEDKPRSAILVEYLSRGYTIGDSALEKGIELDKKHGISKRFQDYLNYWDQKFHPVDKARSVDETYKVSEKATQGLTVASQYFEKVVGPENKRKIRDFYLQTHKQVMDIHTEARRLADEKKSSSGQAAECGCTGTGNCKCAPGTCTCANCKGGSSADAGGSGAEAPAGGATEKKTTCGCSGEQGCTCTPGACECKACGH